MDVHPASFADFFVVKASAAVTVWRPASRGQVRRDR
jgi:hypothetical protein